MTKGRAKVVRGSARGHVGEQAEQESKLQRLEPAYAISELVRTVGAAVEGKVARLEAAGLPRFNLI